MPALPSTVSAYVNSLITKLTVGPSIGQNAVAGPANGLSALDAANALELLQEACSTTTPLEAATGSSDTVILAAASTFEPGTLVGSYVLIVAADDPSNDGEVRRIIANDDESITVDEPFPAAIVEDDTYQIVAGMLDEVIETLREGKTADRSVNRLTGESRTFVDGISRLMAATAATPLRRRLFTSTFASGSTTSVCNVVNRGSDFALDRFVGMALVNGTSGAESIIVSNTESTITVDPPFASAPTNGQVARIEIRELADSAPQVIGRPHVALQQENAEQANLLSQAMAAVVAYTLPAYTNP